MLDMLNPVATWVGIAYLITALIRAVVMAFELPTVYGLLCARTGNNDFARLLTFRVYYLPAVFAAPSMFVLDPLGAFKIASLFDLEQEADLIMFELAQAEAADEEENKE